MEMEIKDMILNEKMVVKGIVDGNTIPRYLNTSEKLINRLYRYFRGEGYDYSGTVKGILKTLKTHQIKADKTYVESLVGRYMKDDKFIPLMDSNESIKIYYSELARIKSIQSVKVQRVAFIALCYCKAMNIKFGKKENRLYGVDAINDTVRMSNALSNLNSIVDESLTTLYVNGLLDVPLFDNFYEIKFIEFDGVVAYEIEDEFHDLDSHFNEAMKEYILEIRLDGNTVVHDKSIRAIGSENGVSASNICKVIHLEKLTIGGAMYVRISSAVAHDERLQEKVKQHYLQLGARYRKLKKAKGVKFIVTTNELFKLLIEHKFPRPFEVSVGKIDRAESTVNVSIEIKKDRVNSILFKKRYHTTVKGIGRE